MYILTTPLLVLLLGLCSIQQLYADATIKIRSEGNAQQEPETTFFSRKGLVRIDIVDNQGGNEGYMIFNSHTNELTMVDTNNRRKMDMSEQAMEKQMDAVKDYQSQAMAMMEESIKNMPADQQRMIREQMKNSPMGQRSPAPAAQAPELRVVKAGKGKSNGYDCIKYDAYQGKTKTAQACFASAKELKLSKEDYNAMKAMFRHMHKMAKRAEAMAGPYGGGDQDDGFMGDEADGLPVATTNLKSGEKSFISSVSDDKLSDKMFLVPDYPDMQIPAPPGM